jgi:hypothetical protein
MDDKVIEATNALRGGAEVYILNRKKYQFSVRD